jgi:hypothetical protein
MVIVFAAVWLDVRGLKHCQNLTAGYQAAVSVPLTQGVAELLLAPPFANLSLDHLSPVTLLRTVAHIIVCIVPISFFSAQPKRHCML